GRVTFESESRNTLENAQFSYRLMKPTVRERWVLVTSASHMPRAMGVFRKAGWQPVAYPVDFHTLKDYAWGPGFNLVGGLSGLSHGLYEWLGLVSYRLLGRTDDIFPAPRPPAP
ncbi:MAG: YdcF family protein, partial [Rhodospirillaceae bacterium]|nr:YdcF family protein [Rhodospirillaceae bacterium]